MLPPCFKPNAQTADVLMRVHEGLDVSYEEAAPLVCANFLTITTGPTSRSGYELTDTGHEALRRIQ